MIIISQLIIKSFNMKTLKSILIFLLFSGMILFQSCQKDESVDKKIIDTAREEAIATAVFENILIVMENGENSAFQKSLLGDNNATCPLITMEGTSFPKIITIDFGTDGCSDEYGVIRKGKIIFTLTNRHLEEGSIKTVSFDAFSVNGFSVEGTIKVTNMGRRPNQKMYWKIEVKEAQITSPEDYAFQWQSVREREWIAGENTPRLLLDDQYQITGTTSGINQYGLEFSISTVNPLLIKLICPYITAGSLHLQLEGFPDALIDYGLGKCDDTASITVKGVTRVIKL